MTQAELAFASEVLAGYGSNLRRSAEALRREGFTETEIALARLAVAARTSPQEIGTPTPGSSAA